jgi:propionate catabolism operon transcriptional regulator
MQAKIVMAVHERMITLAEDVLSEMTMPAEIEIEFIELPKNINQFLENQLQSCAKFPNLIVTSNQVSLQLQEIYNINSIPIKFTGYGLLKAINKARQYSSDITVINYYRTIADIEECKNIFNVKLNCISYLSFDAAVQIIKELKESGCKVVIGGGFVSDVADENNMKGIFIYDRNDIKDALGLAFSVINSHFQLTEQAERTRAILDYAYCGIIGTDRNFRISTINAEAEKILGIQSRDMIGHLLEEKLPEFMLTEEDNELKPRVNELGMHGKKRVVYSSLPIKVDGLNFGQVTILQDIETIRKAEEKIRRNLLQRRFIAQYTYKDISGHSDIIIKTINDAKMYARSDASILIIGETGTGKELFAQSIHNSSSRNNKPFVSINCGALPESLLDSELFGYEQGAFTGASKEGKLGLFELAHTGTIFLDEIGEISRSVQVRLLRVLQEKEIMRIGGTRLIPIDVRIISATHQDLWALVQSGIFREDLYYRLNVFEINIPPLRERPEDIQDLVRSMLKKQAQHRLNSDLVLEIFCEYENYAWPGNVRELENILERFSTLANNCQPNLSAYRELLRKCLYNGQLKQTPIPYSKKTKVVGAHEIQSSLSRSAGNKTLCAKMLGISRSTLYRKIYKND